LSTDGQWGVSKGKRARVKRRPLTGEALNGAVKRNLEKRLAGRSRKWPKSGVGCGAPIIVSKGRAESRWNDKKVKKGGTKCEKTNSIEEKKEGARCRAGVGDGKTPKPAESWERRESGHEACPRRLH